MIEDRDPLLLSLFAEPQTVSNDDDFIQRVMAKTDAQRRKHFAARLIAGVVAILYIGLFGAPLQDFAILMAQLLSTGIIDVGESWFGLILSPVNSYAGLLALTFKGFLTIQRKLRFIQQ